MPLLLPLLLACAGTNDIAVGDDTSGDTDTNTSSLTRPTVVINEFLAVNDTTVADSAGEYDDWIELYNTGTAIVQFEGLYLSDDPGVPLKWALPSGQGIDAAGFALFWCDDDDGEGDSGAPSQGDRHTSFNLSSGGETLVLTYAVGGESVMVDAIEYGSQQPDISAARIPDGNEGADAMQYGTPTPDASNGS
ncbi:MAG: lamin tail domain-containing protein [Pseudomonadota bacterium]|nr:lamin tail domain-containing protein [Pseudomonadota bacterium]